MTSGMTSEMALELEKKYQSLLLRVNILTTQVDTLIERMKSKNSPKLPETNRCDFPECKIYQRLKASHNWKDCYFKKIVCGKGLGVE